MSSRSSRRAPRSSPIAPAGANQRKTHAMARAARASGSNESAHVLREPRAGGSVRVLVALDHAGGRRTRVIARIPATSLTWAFATSSSAGPRRTRPPRAASERGCAAWPVDQCRCSRVDIVLADVVHVVAGESRVPTVWARTAVVTAAVTSNNHPDAPDSFDVPWPTCVCPREPLVGGLVGNVRMHRGCSGKRKAALIKVFSLVRAAFAGGSLDWTRTSADNFPACHGASPQQPTCSCERPIRQLGVDWGPPALHQPQKPISCCGANPWR